MFLLTTMVIKDKEAAVKYFTFKAPDGTTTWISYDDADTFKQKVDFANDLGVTGALIWASDTGKFCFDLGSNLLSTM